MTKYPCASAGGLRVDIFSEPIHSATFYAVVQHVDIYDASLLFYGDLEYQKFHYIFLLKFIIMATSENPPTSTPQFSMEKTLNLVNLFFTVVAAGFALWIGLTFTPRLKNLEAQKQEIANKIAEKTFENDLKFKIFEKVIEAVKLKDTVQLSFTIQYTQTMVQDDTIRNILLSLMTKNIPKGLITDSLRTQLKNEVDVSKQQAFIQQESQLKSSNSSSGWRVDIFYVENSNLALNLQKAKAMQAALGDKYQVRVRLLPASVNARPGYSIGTNIIRAEASERSAAGQLQQELLHNGGSNFGIMQSSQSTPNYMSVFIAQ